MVLDPSRLPSLSNATRGWKRGHRFRQARRLPDTGLGTGPPRRNPAMRQEIGLELRPNGWQGWSIQADSPGIREVAPLKAGHGDTTGQLGGSESAV
jgi:hypothetical protein